MPFVRPTAAEIFGRLQGDLKSQLPDFDPYLPRGVLLAMLNGYGAAIHELNGRLERAAANAFADTAEGEELRRIGAIYGITQDPGAKATGVVRYYGSVGTIIPAGTYHVDATGLRYINTVAFEILVGTVSRAVQVYATDYGPEYTLAQGASVELEEPISGITPGSGVVNADFVAGAYPESDDDYRARVLAQMRRRPQGGTRYDFERWMFESSSEWSRVWVIDPASGTNLINIYAVDDSLDPGGNGITPATSHYDDSEDYIKADYRRPLCADVSVQAPTLIDIDPAITLIPNTTDVQDAVKREIVQWLIRDATIGWTLRVSELSAAISRAVGEEYHTLTSPASDVGLSAGQLHVIGLPVFS